MVTHLNVSKLDLADTITAETATQVEKEIVTSNHGSVDLRVLLLLGSNVVEMTVVMTIIVMEVLHHHGRLVVAGATTMAATDKVVVMAVLPAVVLLHGKDRKMPLHLLPRAISMAMVGIQAAMEAQAVVTVVSRLWVLLLVLVVGPVVLVLHQVWELCSKPMVPMELQVALHLHHLQMIFLHRLQATSLPHLLHLGTRPKAILPYDYVSTH